MLKSILNILKNIWDIIGNILEFIYDFLFDWEDDTYEGKEFIENEKIKHATVKTDKEIEAALGKKAANYIHNLRAEVDYLVKEHNLVMENTIRVVIPPHKLDSGKVSPQIFEETIEKIYNQYDKDVILKPGRINLLSTDAGSGYAEMEVESYTVSDELLSSV